MPEILRVSKRVLLTCGQSNVCKYPKSDWILAWVNKAGANQNKWGFTCWQPILAYGKDAYRTNNMGARPDIIIHSEVAEKWEHSCPKPIVFWKKLCFSPTTIISLKEILFLNPAKTFNSNSIFSG